MGGEPPFSIASVPVDACEFQLVQRKLHAARGNTGVDGPARGRGAHTGEGSAQAGQRLLENLLEAAHRIKGLSARWASM
jgi:hypothetical protein